MPMTPYFNSLMEITQDLVVYLNFKREITFFNKAWTTQVGPSAKLGDLLEDYIQPDDFARIQDHSAGSELQIRFVNAQKDSFDFYNVNLNSVEGGGLILSARRIDEEFRARKFLNSMEQVSKTGYWEINLHTKSLFWSEQCHRIHETDPNNYHPKLEDGLSFYPGESGERLTAAVQKMMVTGEGYDLVLKFKTAKGNQRWIRTSSAADLYNGKVVRVYGCIQDITDEKKSLDHLQNSNERFHAIVDNIPVMLGLFDEQGRFEWCNRAWTQELGWDQEAMKSLDTLAEFYPDPNERQKVLEFMMSGSGWKQFHTTTRSHKKIYTSWANVKLSNGKAIGIGMNLDERVKLQNKTQELVQDIQNFFNLSNDMLCISSLDGYFIQLNPMWSKVLGYTNDELMSVPFMSFVHPEDVKPTLKTVSQMKEGAGVFQFENRYRTKSGDYRLLSWVGRPDTNSGKAYAVARDITEARAKEEKIQMASKMGTLGEMASGIAHEINNPLAIISTQARIMARSLQNNNLNPEKLSEDVSRIILTADRIAKIVRGLKTFSRDASNDPYAPARIQDVIDEVLTLCSERFKNHQIEFEPILKADGIFLGNATQVSQVLLNLLSNAYDAVQGLSEKWIRLESEIQNNHVVIRVTDSGMGIPKAIRDKMMNPFFTTKEVGKGTGLGLSISKGIIEEHRGRLYYNEASPHTQFVIEIPMTEKNL